MSAAGRGTSAATRRGVHRVLVLSLLAACTIDPAEDAATDDGPACVGKCDVAVPTADAARRAVLSDLLAQMDAPATRFGQERFNLTGVAADGTQWLATAGNVDRSDVETLVGDHPAVMGFDAWDLAIKPATWSPTPAVTAEAAKYVHAHGGVVEMAFHQRGCAVDSFNAEGNEGCLCRLANDDAFARSWLLDGDYAKVADAISAHGLAEVPIVFRPLHEHNGRWFWWGAPYWNCGSGARFTGGAAYARVFRTIVTYLRRERGLTNLLIAYSPGGDAAIASDAGYLAGYPGDEYVDVLGADVYYQRSPSFEEQTAAFTTQLQTVTRLARARGKVAALTEVGDTQLSAETTSSRWFTQDLHALLRAPGVDLAYAMTWENRTTGAQQFWVPTGAHPLVDDFVSFASMPGVGLLSDEPAHGAPVCGSCSTDADGDRWGWEHEASCRVASWCLAPRYPICARCDSDPDGDGWGWEQGRSCEVLASCR